MFNEHKKVTKSDVGQLFIIIKYFLTADINKYIFYALTGNC